MSAARRQLNVSMLGDFTITERLGNKNIATAKANLSGRSRRLWLMLAYIIINHERGVPTQELLDVFWPEAPGTNPASTLQNNISRIRNMLTEAGFSDARNLLQYSEGLYMWAPDVKTVIDANLFEAYAQGFERTGVKGDLDKAIAILNLYHGDFLKQADTEIWCVNLSIYYRSIFTKLCRLTIRALLEERRMLDVEKTCLKVIDIDPAAEEFSVFLMQALIASGNPQKAIDHYTHIKQLLEETYGVSVSPVLEIEYERAMKAIYGQGLDEKAIRTFLAESAEEEEGAFYCTNTVFREIVQLHVREMRRSGLASQLGTISIDSRNMDAKQRAVNIRRLEGVMTKALRAGDPFTKVGFEQFLILLPSANRENGMMVINRVVEAFKKEYPKLDLQISTSVYDLESVGPDDLDP